MTKDEALHLLDLLATNASAMSMAGPDGPDDVEAWKTRVAEAEAEATALGIRIDNDEFK